MTNYVDVHDHVVEDRWSVSFLVDAVMARKRMILVPIIVLFVLYVIFVITMYFFGPRTQYATLPFHLEFEGASRGLYPNDMPFASGEIVSMPILQVVYEANDLARFLEFDEFSSAVFVVERNPVLEELEREYRSRLDDPKLSPIERERLEREFAQKVETLDRSGYALSMELSNLGTQIPEAIAAKVLKDILSTWASYAAEKKGVLRYQAVVLTPKVISPDLIENRDPLVAADILRTRALEIHRNIETLAKIPATEVVRAEPAGVTMGELALQTNDLLRFELSPLTARLLANGTALSPRTVEEYFESQLAFNQLQLQRVQAEVDKRERMYDLYTRQLEGTDSFAVGQGARPSAVPQLSEGFVDRIVELTRDAEDRGYKRALVAEMQNSALAAVPYEADVNYYERMLDEIKSVPWDTAVEPRELAEVRADLLRVIERLAEIGAEVVEIYELASANLNSPRQLYSQTVPITVVVERRYSMLALLSAGVILFLIAVPFLLMVAILRHRLVLEHELDEDISR